MKLLSLNLKITIGIVLFVVLICAGYCSAIINSSETENIYYEKIGKAEYNGDFLTPVENFKVVTSKYGARIHPITR